MKGANSGGAILSPQGSFTPLRFEIAAPTATIAENRVDLPVIGGRVLYEVWRVIHVAEQMRVDYTTPAAADQDIAEEARVRYALSLEQGLAAIPTGYGRNSTLYYQDLTRQVRKSSAGDMVESVFKEGMPDIYLPQPPILVADARLSFYTILEGDNTPVGITSVLELLVRVRAANGDEILDLARAGNGWL
jgi:hypothetical protein